MEQLLEKFFGSRGYRKMASNIVDFPVYFTVDRNFVNVVQIVDIDANQTLSKVEFKNATQKISWRFMDRGMSDVHVLTILLSNDIERCLSLCEEDFFCWIIQKTNRQLVIYENKTPDFYGLKGEIEAFLLNPDAISDYGEEAQEYNASGRKTYKSIKERALVNHTLLILNMILFTITAMTQGALYNLGDLNGPSVFLDGEWYRFITAMFLHADINHLTGNMVLLFFVGEIVERSIGHLKYFFLYFLAGIGGGVLSVLFEYIMQDFTGSIGASGAIFGIMGALLYIAIRNKGQFEGVSTIRLLFMISYTLYMGFTSSGVDNMAHVGGLLCGFLLAVLFYRKHKKKKKPKKEASNGGIVHEN